MSDYLPSFIVEPVLRQARRFSERVASDDPSATATASNFSLPAVPDFQRFYPTRFWNQSPPLPTADQDTVIPPSALDHHENVQEEGTLRSIARNIQLWANQINNLDVEDEVLQEPPLPSVEVDENDSTNATRVITEEPEALDRGTIIAQSLPYESVQNPTTQSTSALDRLSRVQRTNSETSTNPAHELPYRSRMLENSVQGRSQSDPLDGLNIDRNGDSVSPSIEGQRYTEGDHNDASVRSSALPEDDGMGFLRQRINAAWSGPGTAQEKSRLVHAMMTERYRASQKISSRTSSVTAMSPPFRAASPLSLTSNKSNEPVFNLSPVDLRATFAPLNSEETIDELTGESTKPELGCVHYKRNVKMQCATCDRWYTCRLCHDEKEDHQLPRRDTRHMLCMICNTPQGVSQFCKMCHTQAAYYYCSVCKLWNNDASKSIYHCDDCGICRLGQGLGKDFFHCKTCAACMSIQAETTHKCIERSTKCDCPICGEFMFTSSEPVAFMKCGHSIHKSCFLEWHNTSYKCPICSKTIANMESQFRRLDRYIEEQPMPEEYSHNRSYIFCNDCNSRSVVKYHWLGVKCAVCDSYNTAQLELLGAESSAIQERADRAQEMGVGEASLTASQSQTPTGDLSSPSLGPETGHITPMTTSSATRSDSGTGTPRSSIAVPIRRDSPFHNLPHSPSRSARAMSPVVGSYFGTGQRSTPTENRRGSYFSVLSFGASTDGSSAGPSNTAPVATGASTVNNNNNNNPTNRTSTSRLSQSHLSPELASQDIPRRGNTPLEDDDDMDFWGGHSPRSHDADIVDLDLEEESGSSESSSDEAEDWPDDDEDDDPMDILIGHR